jgi:hypothetical protein
MENGELPDGRLSRQVKNILFDIVAY